MAEPPSFFILDPRDLEPASTALQWLGRVVANYASPSTTSYVPENPLSVTKGQIKVNIIDNAVINTISSKSSAIGNALTSVVETAKKKAASSGVAFQTSSMVVLRLRNHPQIFNSLKQDVSVLQQLREMLSWAGRPAYMIVGVAIWTDASFFSARSHSDELSGSVTAPIIEALSVANLGVPIAAGDPSISGSTADSQQTMWSGFVRGSHIFAFEYKTVRRRLTSVMPDFQPRLERYGPRVEGNKVFSGHDSKPGRVEDDAQGTFEVDGEDIVWTEDIANDDGLEEVEVNELSFVVKPSNVHEEPAR